MAERKRRLRVRVPATIANLGPGFDSLGMALELANTLDFTWQGIASGSEAEGPGEISFSVSGEGCEEIPPGAENLVLTAAQRVWERAGRRPTSAHVHLENRIPLARGLGSSAAAIVGGLVGANALVGSPLTPEELLPLAVELEGHPDNVLPALRGGITVGFALEGEKGRIRALSLPPPRHLAVVVAVPEFPLSTLRARGVLPHSVPFSDAVFNVSRASFLVAALALGRLEDLGAAMADRLHQPYRAPLVPGLSQVLAEAQRAGAYGSALSGAGPSVMAFTPPERSQAVGKAMQEAFAAHQITCRIIITRPARVGARVERMTE
ncbi:MAG: homoserine kinase [Bacillota bacterium]|nr:homoserine kinase [Bacillota bacterium]